MNQKFFQKYGKTGYDKYLVFFSVVSDGEIITEEGWEETDYSHPEYTLYQCHNPSVCVEDYMEKQRRIQELQGMIWKLKEEQKALEGLLSSALPYEKPVLFRDTIVTVCEDKVEFQKVLKPDEIENPFTTPTAPSI